MAIPELEPGERHLATIRADRGRYWRVHGVLALLGMAGAGLVLWWLAIPYPAVGALGAVLAVAVRAVYLQDEQLALVWHLTDRRVILPSGGSVGLIEIAQQRRLLGDVQLVTRAGDKHLIRYLADPQPVVDAIAAAAARRARRR